MPLYGMYVSMFVCMYVVNACMYLVYEWNVCMCVCNVCNERNVCNVMYCMYLMYVMYALYEMKCNVT